LVRDGIPFVIAPLLLAFALLVFGYWPISLVLLLGAGFMAFFFRDPRRAVPQEPGVIVSPADGRVTLVQRANEQTDSESLVSIFLSPFDVHVNRAPIAGEITEVSYKAGKFLMATNPKARLLNEQNTLTIRGDKLTVRCTQIAGVLARRIVCWKHAGENVKCGERFGMIKFGSRTDLVLPSSVEILVQEGTHVRGGVTIIGKINQ
jgi:phosphatidylserine decarboxylase